MRRGRRGPYQHEEHDQYEYCGFCLKRSCRGTCISSFDWLHTPEEQKKPKATPPLRLNKEGLEWLKEKRKP